MPDIIHADMDAFYASVEQRDDLKLKGRPVIVGGNPNQRGVVSASSYEARKYGVHSAMPLAKAYRLCPSAVFLPVNMDKYIKASDEIMQIFHKWTPLVEAISLDEAFLDITNSKMLFGDVCKIGAMIKQEIVDKVHLTLSVGIASNKFVAKIASDLHKPDGFTVVEKGKEMEFLKDLPIGKLWGVGKVTEIQLTNLGISTIGELAVYSVEKLAKKFGKQGESLHKLSLGIDESPVIACYEPKSIGRETTFQFDTADIEKLKGELHTLSSEVAYSLRKNKVLGKTITLKLRHHDFTTITRSKTLDVPTDFANEIYEIAKFLLEKENIKGKKIRLIGVSTSNFLKSQESAQLSFFNYNLEKKHKAIEVAEEIRAKFGRDIITHSI